MTLTNTPHAIPQTKRRGVEIEFRNVNFRFAGAERNTLTDISLSIKEGQRTALVGMSGSGKSTILSLLNGLEPGYTGSVLIDGSELRTLSHHQLNSMMTLVTQEPFIMRRTVADNIAFGAEIDRTQVESAAARASAHDFITKLPSGYDTEVAENGSTLSGGQRQRICLARALARTPRLLLLDEPTSKLDNQSQRAVRDAIDNLTDMTIIEVAHRLSMVRRADLIIVIDNGKVSQQGTFDQLAAVDGVFADLLSDEQDRG